eukprot:12314427-Prorocentrum_lima.AAC.1
MCIRDSHPPVWDGAWLDNVCNHAGGSAPGPDGVPYEAYKHCQLARDLLQEMGNHLFMAAAT